MALLLLYACIILAACSDQDKPDATANEATEEKAKGQKAEETASTTNEIPKASLELEGMIA